MLIEIKVKLVYNNFKENAMQKLIDRVHQYLLSVGMTEKQIENFDSGSVYLAQEIAIYALQNNVMPDGKPYVVFVLDMLNDYQKLIGIKDDDPFCIDVDLLVGEFNFPYNGAQEVIVLHNVIDHSNVSLEEIRQTYDDFGLGAYFKLYIEKPLTLLTYKLCQNKDNFLWDIIEDQTACLVKWLHYRTCLTPPPQTEEDKQEVKKLEMLVNLMELKWDFANKANAYLEKFNSKK